MHDPTLHGHSGSTTWAFTAGVSEGTFTLTAGLDTHLEDRHGFFGYTVGVMLTVDR